MYSFFCLYQIMIFSISVIFQAHQFHNFLLKKRALEKPYVISIRRIKIKLSELQENTLKTIKLRNNLLKSQEDVKSILYHQILLYILEIICFEITSHYHNNLLAGYFQIKKKRKLVARKYFWAIFYQDIKTFVRDYNFFLTLKRFIINNIKSLDYY